MRSVRSSVLFPMMLLALFAVPLTGCDSGGPPLGDVSGTVTLDGKPVPNAYVVFTPEGPGRPSTTKTDDQGRYTLTFTGERSGALVGKHRVTVSTGDITADGKNIPEIIPAKYNKKGSITVTVNEGENEIPLELTSN